MQGTEVSFCDDEAGFGIARVMGKYSCWLALSSNGNLLRNSTQETDRDFQALQLKR